MRSVLLFSSPAIIGLTQLRADTENRTNLRPRMAGRRRGLPDASPVRLAYAEHDRWIVPVLLAEPA